MLALDGCSNQHQPVSIQARPDITGVRIAPVEVASNAYQQPSGIDTSTSDKWGSRAYRWSQGDNIVGLVGNIVSSSIAVGQQGDFAARNGDYFGAIEKVMRRSLPDSVVLGTNETLRGSALGQKLTPSGPSKLICTVTQYGLVRTGVDRDEEVLVSPCVSIRYALMNDNGKLALFRVAQNVTSGHSYPLRSLAADPTLLVRELNAACANAAREFKSAIR